MIEIRNLNKSYAGQKVVDDFSLSVKDVRIFGILGQNGSGKTTIMKMVVGLTSPDSGKILIDGKPSASREVRSRISFMPESPYYYDRLTGIEFLEFCNQLFDKTKFKNRTVLEEILKKVGIWEARKRLVSTYSKGMKQRLGFAQALVNDPEYLFLDEPLDGLDPVGRKEIKEIISGLAADGRKIFFNSHILYDIEELCEEMAIINAGKLLYSGSVKEFCSDKSLEEQFVAKIEAHREEEKKRIADVLVREEEKRAVEEAERPSIFIKNQK